MIRITACGVCTCGLIVSSAALLGAPEQTAYPGQPTRATVWIQNRSKSEAVPVLIQKGETEAPLRVKVTGIPVVTVSPATVVQVRVIRPTWEYKEMTGSSAQSAIGALNAAGLEGWELITSPAPAPDGMRWLLKRQR
jgi:hypothetical protein